MLGALITQLKLTECGRKLGKTLNDRVEVPLFSPPRSCSTYSVIKEHKKEERKRGRETGRQRERRKTALNYSLTISLCVITVCL